MKSLLKTKLIFLTVGLSATFLIISYMNNISGQKWLGSMKSLSHILDSIQLIALFTGILVAGNPDAPNPFAFYAALFVTYMIIFGGLIALSRLLYKKFVARRRS